jgi:type I restriction enzyme S subunit
MAGNETTHLGDLFKNRREPGIPDLPLMSVTMNDGLVDRESLERKMDSTLESEGHLLVRAGDIAYNMMRMWQGASGLASHNAIVSPAYIVLAPTTDVDPLFASYWFKSARMIYLFWAYSYGITSDRLRLYYKDFAKIPVAIPPKPRQELIGKTLAAWDQACGDIRQLVDVKRRRKQALAQRLLTETVRLAGFENPWQFHQLGDITTLIFSNVDKNREPGETPVFLCNYTDVYYNDLITRELKFMEATASAAEIAKFSLKQGDVVITKDSETPDDIAKPAVVTDDMPGVVCGYHLAIVRPKAGTHGPFLAQLFRLPRIRHEFMKISNGVTRFGLGQASLRKMHLRMPELKEQKQIADVLGTADREIALLERKLLALQTQKKALMQQLLSGKPHQHTTAKNGGKP